MTEIGRLAGALLVRGEEGVFLVGNPKEPCDWRGAGLQPPAAIDAVERPVLELVVEGEVDLGTLRLRLEGQGRPVAEAIAERLLIRRNGAVSERLWNLVCGGGPEGPPAAGVIDATWLRDVPRPVWNIVRDTVLRCS